MFFKNSGPIYRDMLRHYNGWSPSGPQVVTKYVVTMWLMPA